MTRYRPTGKEPKIDPTYVSRPKRSYKPTGKEPKIDPTYVRNPKPRKEDKPFKGYGHAGYTAFPYDP